MRFYDVCTSRTYMVNGEKRVAWYKAGEAKQTENGAMYLRLFANPDTEFILNERIPDVGELPDIE